MAKKRTGGINVRDSSVSIEGDAVGRDKIEEHLHVGMEGQQDKKGGCVLFLERTVVFIFSLLVAGAMFGVIGALIGGAASGGDDSGIAVGVALGVLFAIGIAIVNTSSISKYRRR